jgi:hypothetical protein
VTGVEEVACGGASRLCEARWWKPEAGAEGLAVGEEERGRRWAPSKRTMAVEAGGSECGR